MPTLVALGLSQLDAEATSLLAILPDRRRRHLAPAPLRQRPLAARRSRSGSSSIAGVAVGVQVATALPEDTLRRLFAVLLLAVAAQLAWRSRRPAPYPSEP